MSFIDHLRGFKRGLSDWFLNSIVSGIPSLHIRRGYMRFVGVKMTSDVCVYRGVEIRGAKKLVIDKGSTIGPKVLLDARNGLKIGKCATIAYEAVIWSMNHDYNDIHFSSNGSLTEIGDYVWICSRSIILPGIKIGEGAVVASGAIVTHDVSPYTVVAGIPARVVGKRDRKDWKYGFKNKTNTNHVF